MEPEREELEVSGVELRLPMMLDMAMAEGRRRDGGRDGGGSK